MCAGYYVVVVWSINAVPKPIWWIWNIVPSLSVLLLRSSGNAHDLLYRSIDSSLFAKEMKLHSEIPSNRLSNGLFVNLIVQQSSFQRQQAAYRGGGRPHYHDKAVSREKRGKSFLDNCTSVCLPTIRWVLSKGIVFRSWPAAATVMEPWIRKCLFLSPLKLCSRG